MENNIVITDRKKYNTIIDNIDKAGKDSVHFLVDFDNTLTKATLNGKKIPGLTSLIRGEGGVLGSGCAKEDSELFEKYYPIEIDPDIDLNLKKEKMTEWWKKSFGVFIKYKLNKNDIKTLAEKKHALFREGVREFFSELKDKKIPIVIMSASGIGEKSILYTLEAEGLMSDNIHIISNDFVWDDNGTAIDYKRPIIHSFNKSETTLSSFPNIYKEIENRKNVILLGDSLGDHHMIDGFNYDNLLCIGYLNHDKPEQHLSEYKKRYDVIITGDGDFSFINTLIEKIN